MTLPKGMCQMLTYCRMDVEQRPGVEVLLGQFLREDEHYLASSAVYGDSEGNGLGRALQMFLEHPELGFVWVGIGGTGPVAACVVCFAISTSTGTLVAKLDDVCVVADRRGEGNRVGTPRQSCHRAAWSWHRQDRYQCAF